MKHCDKCQVDILTNRKYCPLCHQVLSGENDPNLIEVYPEYVPMRREMLPITKKVLLFMTLVSILILLAINLLTWQDSFWSLIPIGGILYFWLIVRFGVLSKQNIAFKLAFLTTVLVAILNLIDQNYGDPETRGWALDYVTPFAFLACNLAISAIIWIRRINYRDYMIYLMSIIIFSLIPIVLALFNVIETKWPAISALGTAIFILLFIIFFFPKSIKEEIRKRFHM
ncbi:MAG: hypothetical protein JXB20_02945 [Bacilli bacterium]|nr:hypothetical protein [Bacilli bacterium]MBN2697005.1 hypothetical protein [Bacilli bacterium]